MKIKKNNRTITESAIYRQADRKRKLIRNDTLHVTNALKQVNKNTTKLHAIKIYFYYGRQQSNNL